MSSTLRGWLASSLISTETSQVRHVLTSTWLADLIPEYGLVRGPPSELPLIRADYGRYKEVFLKYIHDIDPVCVRRPCAPSQEKLTAERLLRLRSLEVPAPEHSSI